MTFGYDPPRDHSFAKVMAVGVVMLGLARPLSRIRRSGRQIPSWAKWVQASIICGASWPVIEFAYFLYDRFRPRPALSLSTGPPPHSHVGFGVSVGFTGLVLAATAVWLAVRSVQPRAKPTVIDWARKRMATNVWLLLFGLVLIVGQCCVALWLDGLRDWADGTYAPIDFVVVLADDYEGLIDHARWGVFSIGCGVSLVAFLHIIQDRQLAQSPIPAGVRFRGGEKSPIQSASKPQP